jgi:predicted nuclease with RNAse H fold
MKKALGIDLGMRPKTAMALMSIQDGKVRLEGEVRRGLTDRDILKAVWTLEPDIIVFDAPLTGEMGRQRETDLELRKLFRAFSDTFSAEGSIGSPFGRMLFPITYRAFYLRDQLKGYFQLMETHPLADFVFLDNDPERAGVWRCRKADNACQYELLRQYVPDLPAGLDDDQYDAVMCALTGCVELSGHAFLSLRELPSQYSSAPPFKVFDITS